MNIEINKEFTHALDLIDNGRNVFITGKAGTGKSTLLEHFRGITDKKIVVLAPTGVSALNVKGQTIHSFFRFGPDITLDKVKRKIKKGKNNIYKELDAIVIDEISMVRADLMDCIDKSMRVNCGKSTPFAGKQMIFFGDLYQLPPVITSKEKNMFSETYETGYFFSAEVMKRLDMEVVELEKIYRQKEKRFIEILNSIRNNTVTEEMLETLNTQYDPDFEPKDREFWICLTTRNRNALQVNEKRLKKIKAKKHTFEADITGTFEKKSFPTDPVLSLKKGAQVMLLNNDPDGRWVNGSVGRITAIQPDDETVQVELAGGDSDRVEVHPYEWDIFRYVFNEQTRRIDTQKTGSFIQYPLRLAWAVTIHKGQGKTFDNVILDISGGTFTPGQVYVGLSRCTALDGLVLKRNIEKKHIFMDWNVVKYMTSIQYKKSEQDMPLEEKINMIQEIIDKGGKVEIVYLKSSDVKSKRVIEPEYVGELEYKGKPFTGIEAYCLKRKQMRNFRVDRILKMREV